MNVRLIIPTHMSNNSEKIVQIGALHNRNRYKERN